MGNDNMMRSVCLNSLQLLPFNGTCGYISCLRFSHVLETIDYYDLSNEVLRSTGIDLIKNYILSTDVEERDNLYFKAICDDDCFSSHFEII